MTDATPPKSPLIHGFYQQRLKRCEHCGQEYVSHKLTSRYCSDQCRITHGRYGRSYGTVIPRQYGVTKT
jgi:hypothetical protein